jgi:anti-sigma factor RsiW
MKERDTYRSQFAAYFAGRLSADDAARLEAALARDAKLAHEAEALRPVARRFERGAETDAVENFRLSPDRLSVIRAAAARHIVDFPGLARPSRVPSRPGLFIARRFAPALAAAVAIVIGAITGFNTGRENFGGDTASWRMASQIEPAPSSSGDADPVHVYPPAYGLDHYISRPAHGAAAIGFAVSTPLNYGLPGPRPGYLIRGNSFLLQ